MQFYPISNRALKTSSGALNGEGVTQNRGAGAALCRSCALPALNSFKH